MKGFYIPKNPQKYIHSNSRMNEATPFPQYRSSWELKFFKFLDLNESVMLWTSEPFGIPYFHPYKQKVCRYYPDFMFIKDNKKFLVEIKPLKESRPSNNNYDNTQYTINSAKWEAAKEYCRTRNMEFCVLTELQLKTR